MGIGLIRTQVLLLLWVGIRATTLAAAEPTVHLSVYNFAPYDRFDVAAVTELKGNRIFLAHPNELPRVHHRWETTNALTQGSLAASLEKGTCPAALLREVQGPALKAMLMDGYISQTLYEQVIDAMDIWTPKQLRFAVSWSELGLDEAAKLWGGADNIPWHRVMGNGSFRMERIGEADTFSPSQWSSHWPNGQPLRIVRAIMAVGVGQIENPETGELLYLPLAWEKDPRHSKLTPLPAESFKLRAEFTRALVEHNGLPGDIRDVMGVLTSLLFADAELLGVPASDYILFARVFEQNRARRFETLFGCRRFSPELKSWFEADFEGASRHYVNVVPRLASPIDDEVLLTRLELLQDFATPNLLSERLASLQTVSGGALGPEDLKDLMRLFNTLLKPYFNVSAGTSVWPHGPIMVRDSTGFIIPSVVAQFCVDRGMTDEKRIQDILLFLQEMGEWEFDVFASYWNDTGLVSKFNQQGDVTPGGITIYNLNPQSEKVTPQYALKVLLSVYRYYRSILDPPGWVAQTNLLQGANILGLQNAALWGQTFEPISDSGYDPEAIMKTIPFAVTTTHAKLAQELKNIGGEETFGSRNLRLGALDLELNQQGMRLAVEASAEPGGYTFTFRGETLHRLDAEHSGLDLTHFLRLSGYHRQNLRHRASFF